MTIGSYFQKLCWEWANKCLDLEIVQDKVERRIRLFEECCELMQAADMEKSEAIEIVEYVFARQKDPIEREVGGIQVSLAVFCTVHAIDTDKCSDAELKRCFDKIDVIREKQKTKPKLGTQRLPTPPSSNSATLDECVQTIATSTVFTSTVMKIARPTASLRWSKTTGKLEQGWEIESRQGRSFEWQEVPIED